MKFRISTLALLIFLQLSNGQHKQSCYSPIYCQGDFLDTIQMARIYKDSKSFVDMAMVYPVNETLQKFNTMMLETDDKPSPERIREFVSENFQTIGEIEEWIPRDYNKNPKYIKEIPDPVVRNFAQALHDIWPTLTRVVTSHVFEHPDTHSIIPVKNPFIIPGGRFKEYYYWDSYWIIKGLLLGEMYETARGIILNLLSMIERFGFIPNGGRIYYLNRTQPPMIIQMVNDYIKYTKDYEFLTKNIGLLDKEIQFWFEHRVVKIEKNGKEYELATYGTESDTPRPESYIEDVETCAVLKTEEDRYECYTDLKAGAESGWDYTARWFYDKQGDPSHYISDINTRRTAPADLNGFLYKNFRVMTDFYSILQNEEMKQHYADLQERWLKAIEELMWNEEDGTWYDYDLKLNKQRKYFASSNIVPLWAGAFDKELRQERGLRSARYLKKMGIDKFKGGVPISLFPTGQQWDYPNAWAVYQNMIFVGLDKSGDPEAQELAKSLAHNWVNSIIRSYHENKAMFEKYNSLTSGTFGGGGEYVVQAGFGWTNGALLELVDRFFRSKTRKYIGFN